MEEKRKEVYKSCDYFLNGHRNHIPRSMKEIFQELSDFVADQDFGDNYGTGEYIQAFEKQIAELLGKESAVFMPSGIMAQQIALRIWCERKQNFKVAFHPTAHLEAAEYMSYSFLHNIKRVPFTAPEMLSQRLLTIKDFQDLKEQIAVLLLELPQREIGGQLPLWDELEKISTWARENQIMMHLDGARLWECKSFYKKKYSEICEIFDSVYVSFYKGLGGLTGAILAGEEKFISEAKIWQKRHGGNLYKIFPYVVSAKLGLDKHLKNMDLYFAKTQEIVQSLSEFEKIKIVPNPPHVNMFHMFIEGDLNKLIKIHLEAAEKYKTWLFHNPEPSILQNYCQTEIYIGENALKLNLDTFHKMFEEILKKIDE